MDDAAGYRFSVLTTQDCADGVSAKANASLQPMNVNVITADSDDAKSWLKTLNASAVIVRPDRYVFGTAADAPQLELLVERLAAALAPGTQAPRRESPCQSQS